MVLIASGFFVGVGLTSTAFGLLLRLLPQKHSSDQGKEAI